VGETLLPAIASAEENQVLFGGVAALVASTRAKEGFTDMWRATWLYRLRPGVVQQRGFEQAMRKNFLGVKGMCLMGVGWA